MRSIIVTILFLLPLAPHPALAQTPSADSSAKLKKPVYTTTDTDIGTLLDNPKTREILDRHIPGFSTRDNVDMARSFTLRAIQQHATDTVTDAVLAAIDADLAKLRSE